MGGKFPASISPGVEIAELWGATKRSERVISFTRFFVHFLSSMFVFACEFRNRWYVTSVTSRCLHTSTNGVASPTNCSDPRSLRITVPEESCLLSNRPTRPSGQVWANEENGSSGRGLVMSLERRLTHWPGVIHINKYYVYNQTGR